MNNNPTARVLVTGSSRGIGAAIAKQLAATGFKITMHGRTESENLKEAARSLNAEMLYFDVANRLEAEKKIKTSIELHGPFYGVVCNAGIAKDVPFPAMDAASWEDVIQTNLGSFYNIIQPLVMPMIQARQGGRIVTLSSISGLTGNRGQVNYSASKAGIIGATRSLAQELAKRRISVNCVAPGIIETDMTSDLPLEEIKQRIPMQRVGTAAEVASLVGYLFSDAAEYITGQVISINGGLV